jgi:DMSO/TMAO reductase YedYZ molybdopterin-dependent catalytic subunit
MTQQPISRRQMLKLLAGGGATFILVACGRSPSPETATSAPLPTASRPGATAAPTGTAANQPAATVTAPSTPTTTAAEPVIETRVAPSPTPGPWLPPAETRLTPNDTFYTLKYHPGPPPDIDPAAYRLVIEGEVDTPLSLTLAEIKNDFPAVTEMRTLQCISNPAGGNLIGNAIWTGVPLAALLEAAGLRGSGRHLKLESADDYHTGIPRELAHDPHSLLVYEMNGEPLPADHGFPLRALWPGRYGQKQPKWLQRITVQRQAHIGHWEGQGWSDEARVQPTSIIEQPVDRVGQPADFFVGGVAYTTDAGLEKVEVSLDGGITWQPAELLRGPSPLVWTHWWLRAEGLSPGVYQIQARATDNLGKAQTAPGRGILEGAFPDGTDEMHQVVAQVRAP